MSEQKVTYSPQELVKAQREAYRDGCADGRMQVSGFITYDVKKYQKESAEFSADKYPMPKVRRNRTVVLESGWMRFKREVQWDAENQKFTILFHNGERIAAFNRYQVLLYSAIRFDDAEKYLDLLKDLQENPTELVDADEAEE
jgi:hypothetical protein